MKSTSRLTTEFLGIIALTTALFFGKALLLNDGASAKPQAISSTSQATPLPPAPITPAPKPVSVKTSPQKEATPWPGFTIYPESGTAKVYLVNMSGKVVHHWDFDAARARLLPNGNLLVIHGTKWGLDREPWKGLKNTLREYDWDGNLVWEYTKPFDIHHDAHVLPNGNLLSMHRTEVPAAMARKHKNPALRGARIRSDELFEVTRDKKEVWTWRAEDHLDLNSCGRFPCPKIGKKVKNGKKQFDWTHSNTAAPLPENKWYDAGDARFKPGNILIMVRNWSTAMIVDRESGAIVWEYTGDYKGGLIYGHESHMIPKGLPGEGNILLFDNGDGRGFSAALEINPQTKDVEWVYDNGQRFYSRVAGSMQRLPNGNTLISEDVRGRVIEVSPDKKIVWKYSGSGIRSARAHRYAPDYCPQMESLALQ